MSSVAQFAESPEAKPTYVCTHFHMPGAHSQTHQYTHTHACTHTNTQTYTYTVGSKSNKLSCEEKKKSFLFQLNSLSCCGLLGLDVSPLTVDSVDVAKFGLPRIDLRMSGFIPPRSSAVNVARKSSSGGSTSSSDRCTGCRRCEYEEGQEGRERVFREIGRGRGERQRETGGREGGRERERGGGGGERERRKREIQGANMTVGVALLRKSIMQRATPACAKSAQENDEKKKADKKWTQGGE